MMPSAMEARPEVSLARKPAPGVLPTQMPTSIGQNRRTKARNLPPANACHALVLKFGTTRSPAAWPGAITSVNRPVAMVGSPMPMKPLTKPASRSDPTAIRTMDHGTPNNAAFPRDGDGLGAFEPQANVRHKRDEAQTFRKRPNCRSRDHLSPARGRMRGERAKGRSMTSVDTSSSGAPHGIRAPQLTPGPMIT